MSNFAHQVCSRNEFSSRTVGMNDGKGVGDSETKRKNSNTNSIQRRLATFCITIITYVK